MNLSEKKKWSARNAEKHIKQQKQIIKQQQGIRTITRYFHYNIFIVSGVVNLISADLICHKKPVTTEPRVLWICQDKVETMKVRQHFYEKRQAI